MKKFGALIILTGGVVLLAWWWNQPHFPTSLTNGQTKNYTWQYHGHAYSAKLTVYPQVADFYRHGSFKDPGTSNFDRTYWAKIFHKDINPKDNVVTQMSDQLRSIVATNHLSTEDQVELATTFVQSIPYDEAKFKVITEAAGQRTADVAEAQATWPRAPYETLFDDTGICTDKSFLLTAILSKLGFGTAVIDYPTHMAAAVNCPTAVSLNQSGYCYIETTSEGWVVGEEPPTADGTAGHLAALSNDPSGAATPGTALGNGTVIPLTTGQSYSKAAAISDLLKQSSDLVAQLDALRPGFDQQKQKIVQAKSEVDGALVTSNNAYQVYKASRDKADYDVYLSLFARYQSAYDRYKALIDEYNAQVKTYNGKVSQLNTISDSLDYRK